MSGSNQRWETVPLGQVITIASGQVSPLEKPFIDHPHVGPENISSATGHLDGVKTARDLGLISGKYLFDEKAILYSKIRPNLNKVALVDFIGICSADVYPIWATDRIDRGFLYQCLRSDEFLTAAISHSGRTGLPKINREALVTIPVPLPPLPEQRAIAAILSTWDDAIALTGRLIDALKRRKQALMQLLLTGEVRFPEFAGEAWGDVLLGDVTTVNPSRRRSIDEDTEVSFVTMADVSEEAQITNQTTRKYSEIKNGFTAFEQMDVLVAKITPCFENGKGALASNLENELGFGSTEFHVLRVNAERVLADFVFYHTVSEPFRKKGEGNMSGSAGQKRIPAEFLRSYGVKVPSLKEQDQIVSVLKASDVQLDTLYRLQENFQIQKRGLMQRLLTGQVRI